MFKNNFIVIISYLNIVLGSFFFILNILGMFQLPVNNIYLVTGVSYFNHFLTLLISFLLVISGFFISQVKHDKGHETLGILSGILGMIILISGISDFFVTTIEVEPISQVFVYGFLFTTLAYGILAIDGYILLRYEFSIDQIE